jgi:orotidine-5'-phosphate decarboxylase
MNFADQLVKACDNKGSFLMLGLDPQPEAIPQFIGEKFAALSPTSETYISQTLSYYCQLIIDACLPHVAVAKPNIAFFERFFQPGLNAWHDICNYITDKKMLTIADVKRGDIANTAQAYADSLLAPTSTLFGKEVKNITLDAVTVNPFLGFDTVEPFLGACKQWNKGLFLLCRTSNPGAVEMQSFSKNNQTLSQAVAKQVHRWGLEMIGTSGYSALGAVVGATYPEEARELRALMPHNIFLIPGAGTQGADMSMACAGFDSAGKGAIVNVSRALVKDLQNCQGEEEFLSVVGQRAENFKNQINQALKK